jgi:hypothetical protein
VPVPPTLTNVLPIEQPAALGTSINSLNPWTFIIQSALRAPEAHVVKAIRTLLYGAINYGFVTKGCIPGGKDNNGNDYIEGFGLLDGTVFVRAAGAVIDGTGWVDWGQEAKFWDLSGLGWDEAWIEES